MILRNGILSTLRGRWRTALFTALILLMALSLTLGAGMWAYCSAQLKALDENYTSIALMEYMGADYPDENAADAFARAAAAETDSSAIAATGHSSRASSRHSSFFIIFILLSGCIRRYQPPICGWYIQPILFYSKTGWMYRRKCNGSVKTAEKTSGKFIHRRA